MFQIKNRFASAVLFECTLPDEVAARSIYKQRGYAVKEALKAGADLADADLAGAYLAGAYLAGANLARAYLADADLAGADLADANLARAYLADADLAGAYLAGADLADAYLAGAYLAGADLADAYLAGADLAGAYLADADLAGADLADADLAGAYLADARNVPAGIESQSDEPAATKAERYAKRAAKFRERNPAVPVVSDIDARILSLVDTGAGKLDMSQWHTCETTHCRAGWAITLAGEKGKELETQYGPHHAGRMIYIASTGRAPYFFDSNEGALADLRECAAAKVTP